MRPRIYHVYLDRKGEGRWRRMASGRIVAESGEGYTGSSAKGAKNKAARAAKRDAGTMECKIYIDEA